jgi:archaellum component FlaC
MNSKIDSVLEKLSKLDIVEKKLNEITADVAHLGKKVNDLEQNSKEYEKSIDYLHKEVEDVRRENVDSRSLKSELNRHTKMIESMSRGIESLRRDGKMLHNDVTDLRWRSMKSNLVFTGLGGEVRGENTQQKLKAFLYQELGIQQEIDFANVHRFGKHKDGRHRPIVARFIYNKDRTMIMERAYMLKGKPYGIQEQLPNEMEERRRELYPLMKQMRQEGRRVKLVRDKLIVDGRLYSADDDNADNIDYDRDQIGEMRNTENHVLDSSRNPESRGEEHMEIPVDPRTVDLR